MLEFRRRLPHRYPDGKWLFITWHLRGSLPHALYPPAHKLSAGQAFVWMDRYLDSARVGPTHLRHHDVAEIVVTALKRGAQLNHYDLRAYVVMANHVHVLLFPKIPPTKLLRSLKGATAREANRLLGRTGESLWQAESYDHWVRDEQEFARIVAYIENNPVKAGIVTRPEDYGWSSAETSLGAAHTSVCATVSRQNDPEF